MVYLQIKALCFKQDMVMLSIYNTTLRATNLYFERCTLNAVLQTFCILLKTARFTFLARFRLKHGIQLDLK